MTGLERRIAAVRTAIVCAVGCTLLFTAACTSTTSETSSTSATTTTTSGGPGEASQIPESYAGGTPAVPSDGAPASAAGPSAGATTTAPPVSTSGPVPSTGNINEEVPSQDLVTNPAVPLDAVADFGGQITTKLTDIAAIDAQARVPGELSGPALAITIEVSNDSTDPIGLDSVSVNVEGNGGAPASPITTDPAAPFSGVLMPGEKKTGVYVFTIPVESRSDLSVTVLYSVGSPVVLFTGSVSGG